MERNQHRDRQHDRRLPQRQTTFLTLSLPLEDSYTDSRTVAPAKLVIMDFLLSAARDIVVEPGLSESFGDVDAFGTLT